MNNEQTVKQHEDNLFQFQFDPSMYLYFYFPRIIIEIYRHVHKKAIWGEGL